MRNSEAKHRETTYCGDRSVSSYRKPRREKSLLSVGARKQFSVDKSANRKAKTGRLPGFRLRRGNDFRVGAANVIGFQVGGRDGFAGQQLLQTEAGHSVAARVLDGAKDRKSTRLNSS